MPSRVECYNPGVTLYAMNRYKVNRLRLITMKRAREKEEIKEKFADSGEFAKVEGLLHRKYVEGRPDAQDLPF